ncbi:argonaute-like protein [Mycena vulgaris]|nr:argonaute-like protein [Mycena vulgaris]
MPPRARGCVAPRGGSPRPPQPPPPPQQLGPQSPPAHITTVGVRRPGYGSGGRLLTINVNSFTATIPDGYIYHYDGASRMLKSYGYRLMFALKTVDDVAPNIFANNRAVFDGRKNIFAPGELNLGGDSREFDVSLPSQQANSNRPPRIYKIRLTKVATINTETLHRFIKGQQSQDNTVNTALMALNVVIRMEPSQALPFKGRSFFTSDGSRQIGGGLVLWRGYFQSLRPALNRMLINVDISTGVMYQPGPLMIIAGMRVETQDSAGVSRARVVRKLSQVGANEFTFTTREGRRMTVLKYPRLLCVEVGQGAAIPLELCRVLPGQLVRKEFPDEKEKKAQLMKFASMHPQDRLASIHTGLGVLAYVQSEYVRSFGLEVKPEPLSITARIFPAPTLKYGPGSKIPNVGPAGGKWNMAEKQFYRPATITAWVLILFDLFQEEHGIIHDFVAGCRSTGIVVTDASPIGLLDAGRECFSEKKVGPTLFVVVLLEGGNEIYTIIKHWGDVTQGVPTQCLKTKNCKGMNIQFWANIALKINGKLRGINVVIDSTRLALLGDPQNPTVVMGADVMHPGSGVNARPSYAAVVSSVDQNAAKYIATQRVQISRQELITDLKDMTTVLYGYRMTVEEVAEFNKAPKRLIFYRDGVSEGQFQQVLDQGEFYKFEAETTYPNILPAACQELGIDPKITLVVVGKRHHIRLFPVSSRDADRSGNCPAGTVVDQDIGHPTEFDFYLQSHAGILGTSRPAHYSDNNFSADTMQVLSFALCHLYAGSTCSVSIPAHVYYADRVCSRAKIHFDPAVCQADWSESGVTDASKILEAFKHDYKPLHEVQSQLMYFSLLSLLIIPVPEYTPKVLVRV